MLKDIKPDRVLIVRPTTNGSLPSVELFYEGKSLGISEIIHSEKDPNACLTKLIYLGKTIFAPKFTLQDIENLKPEDVDYLILTSNGKYRTPTVGELKDMGWI